MIGRYLINFLIRNDHSLAPEDSSPISEENFAWESRLNDSHRILSNRLNVAGARQVTYRLPVSGPISLDSGQVATGDRPDGDGSQRKG